jgi:hypothetical protein
MQSKNNEIISQKEHTKGILRNKKNISMGKFKSGFEQFRCNFYDIGYYLQ